MLILMPQNSCPGATSASVKMDLNCCSLFLFSLQGPSQLLHTFHASFIFLFKVLLHCLFVIPRLLFNLDGHDPLQQDHCLGKPSLLSGTFGCSSQTELFSQYFLSTVAVQAFLPCCQQCISVSRPKMERVQYESKNYLGKKVKRGRQRSRWKPQQQIEGSPALNHSVLELIVSSYN